MGLNIQNIKAKLKVRLVVLKLQLKKFGDTYLRTPKQKAFGGVIALVMIIALSTLLALLFQSDTTKTKTSQQTPVAQVSVNDQSFLPQTLAVVAGTEVTWTNAGQKGHKIAANPYPTHESKPDLISDALAPTQKYSHKFTQAGTYYYHDDLNPTMNGIIIVTE